MAVSKVLAIEPLDCSLIPQNSQFKTLEQKHAEVERQEDLWGLLAATVGSGCDLCSIGDPISKTRVVSS